MTLEGMLLRSASDRIVKWRVARSYPRSNARLGVAMQPFEVSYTKTGRKGKKARNVIGVLCPTALAQRMWLARPIFVSLGDVVVDWNAPQSEGYRAMFDTPKDRQWNTF